MDPSPPRDVSPQSHQSLSKSQFRLRFTALHRCLFRFSPQCTHAGQHTGSVPSSHSYSGTLLTRSPPHMLPSHHGRIDALSGSHVRQVGCFRWRAMSPDVQCTGARHLTRVGRVFRAAGFQGPSLTVHILQRLPALARQSLAHAPSIRLAPLP